MGSKFTPVARYFRTRGWKDFIFLCTVLLLWLAARHYLFHASLSDYDKWRVRPKLGSAALTRSAEGHTGLLPCLFVVPPEAKDQIVDSGSIGDCLLLTPDGRQLNLFEDMLIGQFLPVKTDLFVSDTIPLAFTRLYLPLDDSSRRNHLYVRDVYDPYLYGDTFPYTYLAWQLPDGQEIRYRRVSRGTGFADAVYEHSESTPIFAGSRINWNGWGWDLVIDNGFTYLSPEAYGIQRVKQGSLVGIFDADGKEVRISRQRNGDIAEIKSPGARWIRFRYDDGRVIEARDNSGNIVRYSYDSMDRLERVHYPDGKLTKYSYDSENRVTAVEEPSEGFLLENMYDPEGQLTEQSMNGKHLYSFRYSPDKIAKTLEVSVIGPKGKVTRVKIYADGGKVFYSFVK